MSAQGLGHTYMDSIINYLTQNYSSNVWPSAVGNLNTSGTALANLWIALSTTAIDGTASGSAYTEPTYSNYARVQVATGSPNFSTIASGTATISTPSGNYAGNPGTMRYVQLGTTFTFPANNGASFDVLYLMLMDKAAIGTGNLVFFGPNTQTPNVVATNAVFTVSSGSTFQLAFAS